MHARLRALTAAALFLILLLNPFRASVVYATPNPNLIEPELPAALSEDDSFDDLPFEQLRQALREEVEHGPKKGLSPRSFKQYNFLIR